MDINNQYSVVVLPKEAWDEIVKILGELKAKVDGFSTKREDEWLNSKAVREYLGSDLDEFLQKHRIKSRYE